MNSDVAIARKPLTMSYLLDLHSGLYLKERETLLAKLAFVEDRLIEMGKLSKRTKPPSKGRCG